jgi:hypothetical protein
MSRSACFLIVLILMLALADFAAPIAHAFNHLSTLLAR